MSANYKDIIHLPRHVSKTYKPMPMIDRAAQFSPFAALTGHDAAIKETARTTENRVKLDVYMEEELDNKLQILISQIKHQPKVKITYFEQDEKKDGGTYVSVMGRVKKIDQYKRIILMNSGTKINIDDMIDIEEIECKI